VTVSAPVFSPTPLKAAKYRRAGPARALLDAGPLLETEVTPGSTPATSPPNTADTAGPG
jgi:hypothetical protein